MGLLDYLQGIETHDNFVLKYNGSVLLDYLQGIETSVGFPGVLSDELIIRLPTRNWNPYLLHWQVAIL